MTAKNIKEELVQDLEATEEEAESVKGGLAKLEKHRASKKLRTGIVRD